MSAYSYPPGDALGIGKPAPCGTTLPPLLKIRLSHYHGCQDEGCVSRLQEWDRIKAQAGIQVGTAKDAIAGYRCRKCRDFVHKGDSVVRYPGDDRDPASYYHQACAPVEMP